MSRGGTAVGEGRACMPWALGVAGLTSGWWQAPLKSCCWWAGAGAGAALPPSSCARWEGENGLPARGPPCGSPWRWSCSWLGSVVLAAEGLASGCGRAAGGRNCCTYASLTPVLRASKAWNMSDWLTPSQVAVLGQGQSRCRQGCGRAEDLQGPGAEAEELLAG